MQTSLYSQIVIFCIVILVVIIVSILADKERHRSQRMFLEIIGEGIILCVVDLLWEIIRGGYWHVDISVSYLVNIIYFFFVGLIPLRWLFYSEIVQGSRALNDKKNKFFAILPFAILAIVDLTTFQTGALFYLEDYMAYYRGPLYFIQPICSLGYLIVTAITDFFRGMKKENYANRANFFSIAYFPVIPIICGVIQILVPRVPILMIGMTLATLQVYIRDTENKVSIDALTRLANRAELIRYLGHKLKEHSSSSSKQLYMLIMDMDYFKEINDKFGHVEGDRALMRMAGILKDACNKKHCFLARYGGDEFIIIHEARNQGAVDKLWKDISQRIKQANETDNKPYELSLTMGYAIKPEGEVLIPDFIDMADRELYKHKNNKKTKPLIL